MLFSKGQAQVKLFNLLAGKIKIHQNESTGWIGKCTKPYRSFFYLVIVLYVLPLTSHSRLWKKRRNKTKLSIKQNIYLQITGVKPFHSITQHYSKHSVNLTKNKTTSRNICKTTLKFYQVYVISSKAQVSLICLLTLMSFIILLKRDN